MGHVIVSPWSPSGSAPAAFGIAAGIWLIVTQWLASGLGGYLAGRLREKWVGIRTDEVMFRDTAHGFLAWDLATLSSLTVTAVAPTATGGSVSPEAAEAARKAAAAFAFYSSWSLLIGAFIASVAGGLAGFIAMR